MEYRLKKNNEITRVFHKGKRGFSRTLTVVFFRTENELKYGIAVTKKHGGAVKRNRIKRVIRAAMRELLPSLKTGYHIMILPKPDVETEFHTAVNDLKAVFSKEKMFR